MVASLWLTLVRSLYVGVMPEGIIIGNVTGPDDEHQ